MIDWITVFSVGLVPVSALLVGLWATWINRDLLKPQSKQHDRTPAE